MRADGASRLRRFVVPSAKMTQPVTPKSKLDEPLAPVFPDEMQGILTEASAHQLMNRLNQQADSR